MSSVTHITPQLPPAIDGVGDYCANLWSHWPEPHPRWKFLVARGADETRTFLGEVDVREFGLNAEALAAALHESNTDVLVLHYVGYAYQPKGMPVWLPGAIQQWKMAQPGRRVVTMFHEMYARSSPLRSPFWVGPFARRIIGELVRLSDAWVTNCDRYFNQLITQFNARAELGRMLPIGSNIPLVGALARIPRKAPPLRVVIFGLAKTRLWALERHWQLLRTMRERGLIESITLLGKSNEPDDERCWQDFARRIGDVSWERRFDLAGEEISRELSTQDLGLLANEPDVLTKSGVFAALAMHGVVPILSASSHAALPAFAIHAVLSNDRIPGNTAALVKLIQDPVRLQQVRGHLEKTTVEHLAWPYITQRWQQILQRLSSAPPKSPAVRIPILTSA